MLCSLPYLTLFLLKRHMTPLVSGLPTVPYLETILNNLHALMPIFPNLPASLLTSLQCNLLLYPLFFQRCLMTHQFPTLHCNYLCTCFIPPLDYQLLEECIGSLQN